MDDKPLHTHDCDACVFLGNYHGRVYLGDSAVPEKNAYDLYYCPREISGCSLVARYGSKGPEYASAPFYILDKGQTNLEPLKQAYHRLMQRPYGLEVRREQALRSLLWQFGEALGSAFAEAMKSNEDIAKITHRPVEPTDLVYSGIRQFFLSLWDTGKIHPKFEGSPNAAAEIEHLLKVLRGEA